MAGRFMLLVALAILAGGRSAGAQQPAGTYASVEDFQLIDAGVIIPIVEIVEFDRQLLGGQAIEVAYLHLMPDPHVLLDFAGDFVGRQRGDLDQFGVLDLVGMRRVTLRGSLQVDSGRLAWKPELFAMASHEPGRLEVFSPFLRATAIGLETSETPTVAVSREQDLLRVTGSDGSVRSYRRIDPMVLRLVGLIASVQQRSIARSYGCLWPMAEAIAAGETWLFLDTAVAAGRAAAEEAGGDALAMWLAMEERGLGQLLDTYLVSELAAQQAAGRYLQSLIDGEDGIAARWDGQFVALEVEERATLRLLQQLHYRDFDYLDPEAAPFDDVRAALEHMTRLYQENPWSVASGYVSAWLGPGAWGSQLGRLLGEELTLRCGDS